MSEFLPKKILCAVDLSEASRAVLGWARLFAESFGADIEVVHADWADLPRYFTPAQAGALAGEEQQRRAALESELARMARETLGTRARFTTKVLEGHPVPALEAYVATARPDLIVMGSHGRSGVSRLRLGSVAENIARQAACPTLIVKVLEQGATSPKVERLLCPVSFTELARQCLDVSSAVAAQFKAKVVAIHAVEESAGDAAKTRARLCEFVPGEVRRRCELVEVVREGSAAEQIVLKAREHATDLIVIGAEHQPFLEFTTLGTTTERVMRHSPCSVLVIPRRPA
jgi:nucleotide-binding universal stress UspA family protein